MKIYVVINSDSRALAAYRSEGEARWHVALATKRAEEIEAYRRNYFNLGNPRHHYASEINEQNEFDPYMIHGAGAHYFYEETELVE